MAAQQGVILDIGGVLHTGSGALPGAVDAVQRLRAADLVVRFATNTSRQPRRAILAELAALGFALTAEELFTAPLAARRYLETAQLRPLLLIDPALREDFAGLDCESPNAVLLADAGAHFTYANLNQAFRLLQTGAPLIATGVNRYFREPDGLSLDAGPFVHALEYATQTSAVVTGKPASAFFQQVLADMRLPAARVTMIGDDADNDINGALTAGLCGVLVQTGKYQPGDETRCPATACCTDLAAAVAFLLQQKTTP